MGKCGGLQGMPSVFEYDTLRHQIVAKKSNLFLMRQFFGRLKIQVDFRT